MVETGKTKEVGSLQTGMDRKTARKYLQLGRLPSEVEEEHDWRTRTDPFEKVWDEVLEKLEPRMATQLFHGRMVKPLRCRY